MSRPFPAFLLCALFTALAAADAPRISDATRDEKRGTLVHTIHSPAQKGPNTVEILLPNRYDPAKPYPVVYVLPVEAGNGRRWGDGLMEVKKHNLATAHNVICAAMTFDTIPWFMNHASDPQVQQETYLKQVVELVESRYKTPATRECRLLLGFSKSGWGAVGMVLRNPDFFGCAAAWDAPLMLKDEDWKSFEIPKACGTPERFAEYRLATLVERMPDEFKKIRRLAILGEKNFGPAPGTKYAPLGHTRGFHALLDRHQIPHIFKNDLPVNHHWETGWVKPAFEALIELAAGQRPADAK